VATLCLDDSFAHSWHSLNQLHEIVTWNQSNLFIKPFLHQLVSQSAVQKPSLKPKTASNAGVRSTSNDFQLTGVSC
jgi:hypothetical protein